jgi:hypothetical protein
MDIYVFASSSTFCEEFNTELAPEDRIVWYPNLKAASEAEADYYVFLMDCSNQSQMQIDAASCFAAFDDRTIVCCMDDIAYDAYSESESKLYTWWVMDITQAIDLIKMRAYPFVKQTELEM